MRRDKNSLSIKTVAFFVAWLWLLVPVSFLIWLLSRVVTFVRFDWFFVVIISGIGASYFIYTREKQEK